MKAFYFIFFFREIEIEKYDMKSGLVKSIQQLYVKEHFEICGNRMLWQYTNSPIFIGQMILIKHFLNIKD